MIRDSSQHRASPSTIQQIAAKVLLMLLAPFAALLILGFTAFVMLVCWSLIPAGEFIRDKDGRWTFSW